MTALRFTGSARRRARAAGPPAPRRCRFGLAERPAQPRPAASAESLEPRRLLATFTVTTTDDAGPGSLRQAILDANAAAGADAIAFAIPGEAGAVHTIRPLSPLPPISDAATVDATTQPGYAGTPLVELDGSAAGEDADGLTIGARPTIIRGFAINRFSRNGLVIEPVPSGSTDPNLLIRIQSNHLGTDPTGVEARPNRGAGLVNLSQSVHIGGRPSEGNVISGNGEAGVRIGGSGATVYPSSVASNRIGTNAAGDTAIPNGTSGILIEERSSVAVTNNLVSGNSVNGVHVAGSLSRASIHENLIGTDATGRRAIPNGAGSGLPLHGGLAVSGGARPSINRNTISGNAGHGIYSVDSAPSISSNQIGTDVLGGEPLGNGGHGVFFTRGPGARITSNTIAANDGDGVRLVTVVAGPTAGSVIANNMNGMDRGRNRALGNAGNGISLIDCARVTIGYIPNFYGFPGQGSTEHVGGNAGHGIYVEGRDPDLGPQLISILYSRIGVTWEKPIPNGGSGVYIAGGFEVMVRDCMIGANRGDGVTVTSLGETPSTNNFIMNNRIGLGTEAWAPPESRGNGGAGVRVSGGSTGTQMRGNLIGDNGGLPIELEPVTGPNPNDPLDADVGANRLQNYPNIRGVVRRDRAPAQIHFVLQAEPNRTYHVDIFGSPVRDPRGYGRAATKMGTATVTTDASGDATGFTTFYPMPSRTWLTATATDSDGNTSEMSPAVAHAPPRPAYRPRLLATRRGFEAAAATSQFDVPDPLEQATLRDVLA